jgi:hypothetical protein
MSDEELDREWQPTSARPQSYVPNPKHPEVLQQLTILTSTMARSFSLALNDLFKIDNSLADLDAAVSEKCVPHLQPHLT